MSRSIRKNPFHAVTTASSEKEDKTLANRRTRRVNKVIIASTHDDTQLKKKRELSDTWSWDKDGRIMIDPDEDRKLLRK